MAVQGVMGYATTHGSNGYSIRFFYSQVYSIEKNYSTVTFIAEAYHGDWSPTFTDGKVYVNGSVVKTWQARYNPDGAVNPDGGWEKIGGGTFSVDIPHNQDGTCSFTLSIGGNNWDKFLFVNDAYSYTHDGFYGNWTITLNTIPRASRFSYAGTAVIGSACSLKWVPNSTAFAYKLRFDLGNWSYLTDAISPGITTEYTYTGFTIPMEVANQLPNSVLGTMTVTIYTYTNSNCTTQLGSESSTTFTVNIPASIVPTISPVVATMDNGNNSIIKDWNVAVAGYTKVNLTATCSGAYGSSIVSFTITGGYSETVSGSSLNWTGDIITSSGDKSFTVTVTDSRGRVSTSQTSNVIYFYPYSNPSIPAFRAERLEKEQKKVNISAQWSISSIGDRNSSVYELKYKKLTQSSWITYQGTITNGATIGLTIDFDTTSSYNFRLIISDTVGSTSQRDCMISTMDVLLDFRVGGKGLGIGKVCESNSMEVALPLKLMDKTFIKIENDELSLDDYIKKVMDGTATVDYVNEQISNIEIFPVGYIYISVSEVSPASLFGGTWERMKDYFLLASGDAYAPGSTGGEAAHTLVVSELPSVEVWTPGGFGTGSDVGINTSFDAGSYYGIYSERMGLGMAHNNMPPFLAVYMWKRVA